MQVTPLHITQQGQGPSLVLLHGWGVNSAVFGPLAQELSQHYTVLNIDLPGFGNSPICFGGLSQWTDMIAAQLPDNAIVLGWSLGGLVAMDLAIKYPNKVSKLITVASSPCFMANENQQWPGIAPKILEQFLHQLSLHTDKTIERFLAIQAMGSEDARADIKQLKQLLETKPKAHPIALNQGLEMLQDVDLRQQISEISQPWLRIWGRLDGLVPKRVIELMPDNGDNEILAKASHAPFISHRHECIQKLYKWLLIN